MGLDLLEQPGVDRRPDGAGRLLIRVEGIGLARFVHVLYRDHYLDVQVPVMWHIDETDWPWHPGPVVVEGPAAEEPSDVLQRALRGREADPLWRDIGDLLQTLE